MRHNLLLAMILLNFQTLALKSQVIAKPPKDVWSSGITVAWELSTTASAYLVELYDDANIKINQVTVGAKKKAHTFLGLAPETSYYYTITEIDKSGISQTASSKIWVRTDRELENLFLISAISTIAGERPENEFFDILFNFHFKHWMFIGSIDIALSNVENDDLTSTQKELTEATGNILYKLGNKNRFRVLGAGGGLKIFNGYTYWGLNFGNFELPSSDMATSFITVGHLRMLREFTTEENNLRFDMGERRLFRDNWFVEFAFHNDNFPVLKHTRIKGGVLIPAHWNKNKPGSQDRITARIVIEVPIGGVHKFK